VYHNLQTRIHVYISVNGFDGNFLPTHDPFPIPIARQIGVKNFCRQNSTILAMRYDLAWLPALNKKNAIKSFKQHILEAWRGGLKTLVTVSLIKLTGRISCTQKLRYSTQLN